MCSMHLLGSFVLTQASFFADLFRVKEDGTVYVH